MLLTRPPLTPKCPLDLHVLSLPPAFALSQDQTLKLKARSRLVTTFIDGGHNSTCVSTSQCELQNVEPPKSLPAAQPIRTRQPARTPPSAFLFLSSLVKERGHRHRQTRRRQRKPRSEKQVSFSRCPIRGAAGLPFGRCWLMVSGASAPRPPHLVLVPGRVKPR